MGWLEAQKEGNKMQTITLNIDDSIKDKFFGLLNHFSKNEVEILDTTTYQTDDEYLKSIKGMEKSIIEASNAPIEKYLTEDELDW